MTNARTPQRIKVGLHAKVRGAHNGRQHTIMHNSVRPTEDALCPVMALPLPSLPTILPFFEEESLLQVVDTSALCFYDRALISPLLDQRHKNTIIRTITLEISRSAQRNIKCSTSLTA